MSSHCFADFLERLQADGRLVRRDAPTPRQMEVQVAPDPATRCAELLTDVENAFCPLIHGVFSFPEAILAAFNTASLEEAAAKLNGILTGEFEGGWLERLGGNSPGPLRKYHPKAVRTGPSQQIAHLGNDVNLSELPALTFNADEAYRALTAGRIITREPESERLYVGRHDLRVLDSHRLVACWEPSSPPAQLLAHYRRRNASMPLAIAFGGNPVDLLAAMAPLPQHTDAFALTGYLRGNPCELVPARRVDLPVPADAELVIEGTIDPAEPLADAGLGLDATGQLRSLQPGPVITVEAITHRPTPLFPALLHHEKAEIHRALAGAFLPFLQQELPNLAALAFPTFGGDRVWAFASIDKTYPGQAEQFANAFWGLPKMLPVRYLVIVDEDVDVANSDEVWMAVSAHATPNADVRIGDVPPDGFVYEQPPGRMVIDATRPLS